MKYLLPLFLLPTFLQAQPWSDDLLSGVIWSYEFTFEEHTGQILERADPEKVCDLLLSGDHSYELFDEDELHRGNWQVEGDLLTVDFRGQGQFAIAFLTSGQLDLRFSLGRRDYIHRFRRQSSIELPPTPPAPAPKTQNPNTPSTPPRTWIHGERQIRIELTGGGFFGGMDLVQRDFILIKENGRFIHERQTVREGKTAQKKTLSQRQLTELADYIRAKGFFQMESWYGCTTESCEKRLEAQPKPIPLRLAVTDGMDRHVVEVAIWPEDGSENPVSCPPALKEIVDAIRGMSE